MSEVGPSNFFALKMTKRQYLGLSVFLFAVVLLWAVQAGKIVVPWVRGAQAEQSEPLPVALPVNVTSLQGVESFDQMRSFTGTVRARNRSDLAFEFGGKLNEVTVDEGDQVSEGQIIASLDIETLLAQKQAMNANLAQAGSLLAELSAGPRQEKIASARANVAALESELKRAELNLSRREKLRESRAISLEEYDQAIFTEKTARANYNSAQQELAELVAGTRQEQIDAQNSVVNRMQASIAEIDVMLSKSNLLAPFSGTVTRRYLDPGTIAPASAPVIRLVEQQHLEAWVGLPVSVVAELNVGDRQEVLVDGFPHSAVVAAKLPELDPATRTQTVVFEFDKHAADSVVSGQLCEVPIKTLVAGSGFWIPTSALSKGIRGLWSVMVVVPAVDGKGFRTEKRDIEIINTTEANVLARGTINQGDRIVVDGMHRIADGQLVEPNERP